MEEHSSPTSIFPVFMMTSSNGNMFRVAGFFLRGIHRWMRGILRSSVNSPHTNQWRGALMFSLNKRLSKQSRRRWFETPSRSLWRHCNVVSGGGGGGVSVHYARNGLKFATLHYPDYHSLKLTLYFALSGSLSLWCQIIHKLVLSWGGNKRNIRSL